ncbi:P-loop NTPase fold protein [Streptomyces fildesensis]|uniref:P-loop NTPase fold protein n=1 Tax=Streptomyces fildesensis TaxID=375757 RepID=A0ABW8BZK0_9ACTN
MASPYSPHSSWLPYSLLNDEPVSAAGRDLLGAGRVAEQLAGLLVASRGSTPFTLAVDAGWGMGKSSLMRLVDARLSAAPGVQTVWYNAWTSTGDDALEGLIKSVLTGFDKRVLRRGLHRITRHRSLLGVLRALSLLVAGPLGIAAMTDELWNSMNVDAKTRNDMRDVIRELVRDWADVGPGLQDQRMLVVFIDDLDRCSEETVLAVCEAAKIYLDVPGIAFVIGCDRSAMAPNGLLRDMSPAAAAFMEKIFQTSYRIPVTDSEGIQEYVRWCAETAGISRYLDAGLTGLLIERSARNPRRIKRLVNGFVLEATLNPMWRDFGPGGVIRTLLIQYFYPDFYRMMTAPSAGTDGDVVSEFRTYRELRRVLRRPGDELSDEDFARANGFLADHDLAPLPSRNGPWLAGLLSGIEQQLPSCFPGLAAEPAFTSLIGELMQLPDAGELVRRLRQGVPETGGTQLPPEPLADEDTPYRVRTPYPPPWTSGRGEPGIPQGGQIPYQQGPAAQQPSARQVPPADVPFAGMDILWLDPHPDNNARWVSVLIGNGAAVRQVIGDNSATRALSISPPTLLISNVRRRDNPNAGFDFVRRLRAGGTYTGPVIFFTGQITGHSRTQASEVGALKITADFEDVRVLVHELGREQAGRSR